jgi:hypothetical protein
MNTADWHLPYSKGSKELKFWQVERMLSWLQIVG